MRYLRFLAVPAVFCALAANATAQTSDSNRSGVDRPNLVSANPIGLLFQWYNIELEHAVNSTVSVAVAGSRYEIEHTTYGSVDGIARYYPSGRAVRGFSIGASVGYIDVRDNPCQGCTDDSGSSPTIGIRGDYVWILGRDQHFSAAAGIGAKRLLTNDFGTEGVPVGRLSVGWAW